MKKHVELDAQGQPFGSIKVVLCSDIKKYAKDLDPTTDIQLSLETFTTTSTCLYFCFPFCVGIHEQLLLAKMTFWW